MKNNLKNKIAFTNARLIDPNTGLDVIGGLLTENKIIKDFVILLLTNITDFHNISHHFTLFL